MSILFSLFAKQVICPACGSPARAAFGKTECTNTACQYFSQDALNRLRAKDAPAPRGSYHAANPVTIDYRNYLGIQKKFVAERGSLYAIHNHIVAVVEPTGKPIALSKTRITNLNWLGDVPPKPKKTKKNTGK